MRKFFIMAILSICGLSSYAEGYQVNLQGNRQTGMGHTGTGLLMGASSMHFNPGALSFLNDNYEFSVGGSTIFSKNAFQKTGSNYEANSDNPISTPAYFYGATKLSENVAIGLSVTTPYGSSLDWGNDWDGRFLVQDISLQAILIQPTFSYKIGDKIGLGAGFVIANGQVDLNKALPIEGNDMEGGVNLNGDVWSFGYNAGITYKATEALTFGLNYRSKIDMEVKDGDAIFNVPSAVSALYSNTTFDATLPLPSNLTFGVGYKANEKLLLAFDLQYVGWSAYETLSFDFANENIPDSHSPKEFENTLIYRIGAEYNTCEKLALRAGVYYDSTPIKEGYLSPETPGTNKIGISAGFTWKVAEHLDIDGSLLYIHGQKREDGYAPANFYGTYYSNAIVPGIGLTYSF